MHCGVSDEGERERGGGEGEREREGGRGEGGGRERILTHDKINTLSCFRTVQADKIICTTLPLTNLTTLPLTSAVKVLIDSATIIDDSVHFTYTFNPEFYSIYPSITIPAYV